MCDGGINQQTKSAAPFFRGRGSIYKTLYTYLKWFQRRWNNHFYETNGELVLLIHGDISAKEGSAF